MSHLEDKGQEVRKMDKCNVHLKKYLLLGNPHAHFLQEAILGYSTQCSWALHLPSPGTQTG